MPGTTTNQLTLAYAAGASLAAVTLVYVFAPSFCMDGADGSSSQRKKAVVGLYNPANDCFINSILQSFAGLEDLRSYLSRRTRDARRCPELDGRPFLTAALKDMLDALNERPTHKKTITNRPFLITLERKFRKQISRAQQDAHEFLQVVAETLADEHRDLQKWEAEMERRREAVNGYVVVSPEDGDEEPEPVRMPLEGSLKSEIECQACGYRPPSSSSTFVVLTLPVPQDRSTSSINDCIDLSLSTEYVDDFQCAKCRLIHAIAILRQRQTQVAKNREGLTNMITLIEDVIQKDPEKIPDGLMLPDKKMAPRSRIAKRTSISHYPDIIALHLSRSIYAGYSSKNTAKVAFEEDLELGGILDRRKYRLLCVVTHKGGHDSGHYECFRRQVVHRPPYSTPSPSATPLVMSRSSSPLPPALQDANCLSPDPSLFRKSGDSWASASATSISSANTSNKEERKREKVAKKLRRKKGNDKWWRISDEKVREANTKEVMDLRKEVYLLFYQKVKDGEL